MTETVWSRNNQSWDATQYATNGRFVADLAEAVMNLLAPAAGERILDLGCGDGALTAEIAYAGAMVTGCDADAGMIDAALRRGFHAVQADMRSLPFDAEFAAVFSNAALHWVKEQDDVLTGVHRALVPGGRFVAEMGGLGNIAAIRVALQAVLGRHGVDAEQQAASYFPSANEYAALLDRHGFDVQEITLTPRPTLLKTGMQAWLRTFRGAVLDCLAETERERALDEVCTLLAPALQDSDGLWWADYVRLRFSALRRT